MQKEQLIGHTSRYDKDLHTVIPFFHTQQRGRSGDAGRFFKGEAAVHAVRHHKDIQRLSAHHGPKDRLSIGLPQQDAVHVKMEGQDRVFVGVDAEAEAVAVTGRFQDHFLLLLPGHGAVVLEIIDEQEPADAVCAHGKTERVQVFR